MTSGTSGVSGLTGGNCTQEEHEAYQEEFRAEDDEGKCPNCDGSGWISHDEFFDQRCYICERRDWENS